MEDDDAFTAAGDARWFGRLYGKAGRESTGIHLGKEERGEINTELKGRKGLFGLGRTKLCSGFGYVEQLQLEFVSHPP